jgi:5'-methylthioadenosine phosphorylase
LSDLIGLVAGTVFYGQDFFKHAEARIMETRFGPAQVLIADGLAYIPRHGIQGTPYILPHMINHPANFFGLKELGVTEVIGINSTGSLNLSLPPGTIVLPDDYICVSDMPTAVEDDPQTIIPALNEEVRCKLLIAAESAEVDIAAEGVYWQSTGPRLETKAEIRLYSQHADIIGMTMASEAVVAQELGVAYASLCSVDNYAHGLSPIPLAESEISTNAAANADKMFRVVLAYLDLS